LENDKGNEKSQKREKAEKRERQSQKQEDTEEEIKKGVIVSFTAEKIGASDETEKATETEGEDKDKEGKLSREDIKEGLTKFGAIKVGYLTTLLSDLVSVFILYIIQVWFVYLLLLMEWWHAVCRLCHR
jgi:hypothetical protein